MKKNIRKINFILAIVVVFLVFSMPISASGTDYVLVSKSGGIYKYEAIRVAYGSSIVYFKELALSGKTSMSINVVVYQSYKGGTPSAKSVTPSNTNASLLTASLSPNSPTSDWKLVKNSKNTFKFHAYGYAYTQDFQYWY